MRDICLVEGKGSKKRAFRCQFDSLLLLLHRSVVIRGPSNAIKQIKVISEKLHS